MTNKCKECTRRNGGKFTGIEDRKIEDNDGMVRCSGSCGGITSTERGEKS